MLSEQDRLLVSTDYGRILAARLTDAQPVWAELYRDRTGIAFTPASLVSRNGLIFAGQANGNVVIVQDPEERETEIGVETFEPLVVSIFLQDKGLVSGLFAPKSTSESRCHLFAATEKGGDLYHWSIYQGDEGGEGPIANYHATYRQERRTKTSLVTSVCFIEQAQLVVVGDRGGRVLLYDAAPQAEGVHCGENGREVSTLWFVHPIAWSRPHKDRVSCILETDSTADGGHELLTGGFDGQLVRLVVRRTAAAEQPAEIAVRRRERTAGHVDTISAIVSSAEDAEAVVGFRAADAVLVDVGRREEVLRWNVGNWRRAHAVRTGRAGTVTLAYWRDGRVHVARARASRAREVAPGGHGDRVNSVAVAGAALLTGGEDGRVGVWATDGLARVQWLGGHTSGVRAVAAGRVAAGWAAVSGGGLDELLVWGAGARGPWRRVGAAAAGDGTRQRVNAVAMVGRDGEDCILAVFGRSDGSVGVLRARPTAGAWKTRVAPAAGRHAGAVLCAAACGRVVVTGDSQGCIGLWRVEGECGAEEVIRVGGWEGAHNGGVNCVDMVEGEEGGELVVVTGGDDERVVVWFAGDDGGGAARVWRSPLGMHTAAVTGVALRRAGTKLTLTSVGADQRLRTARVERGGSGGGGGGGDSWCVRLDDDDGARVNVPDAAAVRFTGDRRVVVAGCGLELRAGVE